LHHDKSLTFSNPQYRHFDQSQHPDADSGLILIVKVNIYTSEAASFFCLSSEVQILYGDTHISAIFDIIPNSMSHLPASIFLFNIYIERQEHMTQVVWQEKENRDFVDHALKKEAGSYKRNLYTYIIYIQIYF